MNAVLLDILDAKKFSVGYSMQFFTMGLGNFLGPVLGSKLIDNFTVDGVKPFENAVIFGVCGMCAAGVVTFFMLLVTRRRTGFKGGKLVQN